MSYGPEILLHWRRSLNKLSININSTQSQRKIVALEQNVCIYM